MTSKSTLGLYKKFVIVYILKFENPDPFCCPGDERSGDWSSF